MSSSSSKVEDAIRELLPSSDPLDQPDFDCVAYVNKLFPDAASLCGVDEAIGRLQSSMAKTEEDIGKQVRRQSLASAKGKRELQQAKLSIHDLFKQIAEIKHKAEQSERMVEEVTRDIKSLDFAKKNLTASITTLKRLNMLVTGVAQLRSMAAKRQYREVGALLQAVASLSLCFEDFKHIPKIAEAKSQFEALKEECSNLVYTEFEGLNHSPTPAYFSDLCVVVEALGRTTRLQFMSWFVKDRLLDYDLQFKDGEEASKLDNVKARFQWLRRELQFYAEHFQSTFPPSWEMPQLLCEEFCLVTNQKLSAILSAARKADTLSVRTLIDTMKTTIAFEKELNKRFEGKNGSVPVAAALRAEMRSPAQEQELALAEQNARQNPFSPEALKLKWKKFQEEKASVAVEEVLAPSTRFTRIISDAFEPYLDIYVSFEQKEMNVLMARVQKSDNFEERNMVFESSQLMFDHFRQVMDTCASLSRGTAFVQIAELFRTNLRVYAEYLGNKLPRIENGAVKLKEGDEKSLCFAVNTAEYCSSNTEALSTTIKNYVDADTKVDMSAEQERFQALVAKGMQALVRSLETKLVLNAFSKMQKATWNSSESVVAESEYVGIIDQIVRDGATVHKFLSKSRFSFFCDSFVTSFVPRVRESILSLKAISEVGAEQLLLDVAHIKGSLDALPKTDVKANVPTRYKRIVAKEIQKLERLIKCMLTPANGNVIVETYLEMVPKGQASELLKILELRGVQKPNSFLDKYVQLKEQKEKEEKK